MRLTDTVHVLPVPRDAEDPSDQINLTLILDENNGHTLVDSGFPGQAADIDALLAEAGTQTQALSRIILTHQDLDHTGAAAELARASGAKVLAHPEDEPYIDGTLRPFKPSAEILEQRPQMREIFERREPVGVDQYLEDGEKLELSGGIRVIFTPGHTPGHTSLYLERDGILIAGDALVSESGSLRGPNAPVTLDMQTAMQSVRKLAELGESVRTIVCYHGGTVTEDAATQLERVSNENP